MGVRLSIRPSAAPRGSGPAGTARPEGPRSELDDGLRCADSAVFAGINADQIAGVVADEFLGVNHVEVVVVERQPIRKPLRDRFRKRPGIPPLLLAGIPRVEEIVDLPPIHREDPVLEIGRCFNNKPLLFKSP